MEFKNMKSEELEARKAEIATMVDAEDADLDALTEEVRSINEELEARKNAEAKKEEIRMAVADGLGEDKETIDFIEEKSTMENMEIRNSKEYIDAFAEYVKSGDDKQCRALLTENVGGTVAAPELVYDTVKTAWERNELFSLVRKTYLKGNLKVGFEISSTEAEVHTEGSKDLAEEQLVLGTVQLVPQTIKKWISISDEVYAMRGEDFLRYIYDELTYRLAKKAVDGMLYMIAQAPTTSTSSAVAVPAVAASTITLGTVAEAIAHLSDEANNPVIVMNKLTYAAFKAVQYAGSYNADPFEGLRVIFNDSLPAFATATSGQAYAIIGDFGHGALVNFPEGEQIRIKFDDLSLAEADLIKIVGRLYAGLGIVAPNAFVKITK